jgi:hypothetical protein
MPTASSIFRLFAFIDREEVFEDGNLIGVFEPELTDLQKQIFDLLGVPGPHTFEADLCSVKFTRNRQPVSRNARSAEVLHVACFAGPQAVYLVN